MFRVGLPPFDFHVFVVLQDSGFQVVQLHLLDFYVILDALLTAHDLLDSVPNLLLAFVLDHLFV